MKLKQLLNDIMKSHVLGVCIGHLFVIKYKKRFLSHCHLLVIIDVPNHPKMPMSWIILFKLWYLTKKKIWNCMIWWQSITYIDCVALYTAVQKVIVGLTSSLTTVKWLCSLTMKESIGEGLMMVGLLLGKLIHSKNLSFLQTNMSLLVAWKCWKIPMSFAHWHLFIQSCINSLHFWLHVERWGSTYSKNEAKNSSRKWS